MQHFSSNLLNQHISVIDVNNSNLFNTAIGLTTVTLFTKIRVNGFT